jgi:hypothetical protein
MELVFAKLHPIVAPDERQTKKYQQMGPLKTSLSRAVRLRLAMERLRNQCQSSKVQNQDLVEVPKREVLEEVEVPAVQMNHHFLRD